MMRFRDRRDAGRQLAARLTAYAGRPDVVVLALPRGGVPVGFEVAAALDLPLDVFIVRKLGVPGHAELAMGAIASGGARVLNTDVIAPLGITPREVELVTQRERLEVARREHVYRAGLPAAVVGGRTVILVDDGLATGSSMRAAIAALRQAEPARIVVAVPTAPLDTCEALRAQVDEIICAITPHPFDAVGSWYDDFSETTDDEVKRLVAVARHATAQPQA